MNSRISLNFEQKDFFDFFLRQECPDACNINFGFFLSADLQTKGKSCKICLSIYLHCTNLISDTDIYLTHHSDQGESKYDYLKVGFRLFKHTACGPVPGVTLSVLVCQGRSRLCQTAEINFMGVGKC